jgi:hypothetical protein
MTIAIIVSIRHAATTNTALLLPPPPRCRRTSKRAAATAKIALLPSCHLRRQAGRRRVLPPRCHRRATTAYYIKKFNIIDQPFFHQDGNGSTQRQWRSRETTTIAMLLFATTWNNVDALI